MQFIRGTLAYKNTKLSRFVGSILGKYVLVDTKYANACRANIAHIVNTRLQIYSFIYVLVCYDVNIFLNYESNYCLGQVLSDNYVDLSDVMFICRLVGSLC